MNMPPTFILCASLLLAPALTAVPGEASPWNLEAVRASQAPGLTPDRPVVVAVLDSGVYPEADALRGTRILPGRDLVEEDGDPRDDNGHGTHIAALIAGRTGDAPPLCPECVILPVKVLDSRGLGDARTLAAGILYAVEQGAEVINMSMGFDPGYEPGPALARAVEHAREQGVVLVASVGNEGQAGATYPAAYPGVIAVAAVDFDGERTAYSNLSPAVDIAAPGGDDRDRDGDGVPESILSDGLSVHGGRGAEPWLYSGTSQAAAHVSALAGRLRAHRVPPASIGPLIIETAQDVGPSGFDVGTGGGLVDYAAALGAARSLASVEDLPRPWEESLTYEATLRPDRQVEVRLLDTMGRPVAGGVFFGHWSGTRRVLVHRADDEGRVLLKMEGLRLQDLHVDRIRRVAGTEGVQHFLSPHTRPYQGILASPRSRFPR